MRLVIFKVELFILIFAAAHVLAQDTYFLGSKGSGFGGAFVAIADDPSALYWNPAALIQLKRPSLMFNSNDTFSFNFVGTTIFSPLVGTLALGLSRIKTDTTNLEMAGAAFGHAYKKELSLGGSINFLKKGDKINPKLCLALFFRPQTTFAAEEGIKIGRRFWNSPFIAQRLTLGVALRNINLGSQKLGEDFVLNVGFAYLFPTDQLLVAAAYNLTSRDDKLYSGLELQLSKYVRLRSGVINFDREWTFLGGGFYTENFDVDMIYSAKSKKMQLSLTLRLGETPFFLAERYYRQGIEYAKKDDYRKAVRSFEKSLEYNPGSKKAIELLKILKKRISREEEKVKTLLAEAVKYQWQGWYLIAAIRYIEVLRLQPNHKLALKSLQSIKPLVNNDIRKIFKRGIEFFNKEDYKNASEIFKKILFVRKDHREAANYLAKINQICAERAEEHYFRGLGYYYQKRWEKALQEFHKVLKYQPQHEQAQKYLAEAEKQIEKIKVQVKLLFNEGIRYENERQYVKAYKKFYQVLEIDPDHSKAKSKIQKLRPTINAYASMRFRQGVESFNQYNFEEAVRAFQEVLSVLPDHKEAKDYLAKTERNLSSEIDKLYQQGLKYFAKEDWNRAISVFKKALELNPNQPKVQEKMKEALEMLDIAKLLQDGKDYFEKGDYLEALGLFKRVLDKNPGNPAVLEYIERCQMQLDSLVEEYFNKGFRYYINEDYNSAISELDKVLAINPNHRTAIDYRKRAQEKLKALERLP